VSEPQKVGRILADLPLQLPGKYAHLVERDDDARAERPAGRIGCPHGPGRFEDRWFESFDQDTPAQRAMVAAARRLVAGGLDSLVLIGGPGCGKSTVMKIAANEIQDANEQAGSVLRAEAEALRREVETSMTGEQADRLRSLNERIAIAERGADTRCPRWVNVGRLVTDLKAEMSDPEGHAIADQARELRQVRGLLVLDDLGRERISEWSAEVLYGLVSERYDERRPTAVTSNVAAAQLQRAGYGAVLSRLAERGLILELDAPDYRLTLTASAVA
jgi:DNA replication protein DnaC